MRHLAFASSFCTAALFAQQAAPAVAGLDRACGVQSVAGGCLATGPDWFATCTAAGIEFVPVLGPLAPHQPLHLGERSVWRGAERVALREGGTPAATGLCIEHARGGAVERLLASADGLHWSWLFREPLPGAGDLVVRCPVHAKAAPEPRPDGSLRFAVAGCGVDVGGVTGIDAAGRRARGSLRLVDGALELVLPGAFVDLAAFPLLLDPVLSTVAIDTAGSNGASDVAYDVGADRWLVVWQKAVSSTSTLVCGRLLLGDGTPTGGVFQVLPTANVHQQLPAVASMREAGAFLVGWQQSLGNTAAAPFRLRGTLVDARNGPTTLPLVLGSVVAGPSEETPRMASDNDQDGSHDVQIVWNAVGAGIRGTKFHLDPLGTYSTVLATVTSDPTDERPVISRSQRSDAAHLVAWRRSSGAGPAIHGGMVSRTFGGIGTPRALTTAMAGTDVTAFDVDGDGARYGLVWRTFPGGGLPAVQARPVDWNGLQLVPGAEQNLAVQSPLGGSLGSPVVGRFGPKLLAAWSTRGAFAVFGNILGRDLSPDCLLCAGGWSISSPTGGTVPHRFASRAAGGGSRSDGLLSYVESNGAVLGIHTATVAPFGAGGAITPVGSGCGTAGAIGTAGGPFALGNSDFRFTLAGAPAGTVPFLSLGFPGGEIGCGACVLTNAIAFEFRPAVAGAAEYAWALPCSTGFLGVSFSAQWVLFFGAGAPCPAAPGLVSTGRLELTLGQ